MENNIHPTAIIDPKAKIGQNNFIGPYCVIGPEVELGDNNHLKSHVVIDGQTTIGDNNKFFPFSSIGCDPQDKKYKGEKSKLLIGNRNIFREYTTANPGTETGIMATKVGDDNLFMANSHIAHDCIIGNNNTVSNSVALAGHVQIGDFVTIGGLSGVHQNTRIGSYAMIGGLSGVTEDIIPYGMAFGMRNASLVGLNIVGLKRRGFTKEQIFELKSAYDLLFNNNNQKTFNERLNEAVEEFKDSGTVKNMLEFINNDSSRAICRPK